jgi:16S rRNA G527 N7-methylase RsmG
LVRKHEGDSTPVYFVDSIAKKVRAVEGFCEELGFSNTKGFVGRGEELIRSGALKSVNTVVMRAVAPAERAWKWVSGEIPNWVFFLGPQQSEDWKRELSKLEKRKMSARDEKTFALPHGLGQRHLLRISKSSTWN